MEARKLILIAAAILLIPKRVSKPYTGIPRGFRNNNPGNIRIGPDNWIGKVPVTQNTDGEFEQFEELKFGIRAMIVLLRNYILQGDNTITRIISRYAPSTENDTLAYISEISGKTGIGPMDVIAFPDYELINAMIEHENGAGWTISRQQYNQAKAMI